MRRLGQLIGGGWIETAPPDLATQDFAAKRHATLMLFLFDPLTDFLAGAARLDMREPVARRLSLLAREDFDRVAVAEWAM